MSLRARRAKLSPLNMRSTGDEKIASGFALAMTCNLRRTMMINESVHNSLGVLLRQWRERRRMSQLALAIEAEISSRHLSFMETGRSRPSREMVLLLSD